MLHDRVSSGRSSTVTARIRLFRVLMSRCTTSGLPTFFRNTMNSSPPTRPTISVSRNTPRRT